MKRQTLTDLYFMDARTKLIDLAAFLDRIDRTEGADDERLRAFRDALQKLARRAQERAAASTGTRAEEVLLAFSDLSIEPVATSQGKTACGAWMRNEGDFG